MRWGGLAVVVALLAIGFIAYARPDLLPVSGVDLPWLIYLLLALLLVAGAGYGFRRLRFDRGNAVIAALFWGALIVAIAVGYSVLN
jgi:hypothetical protein